MTKPDLLAAFDQDFCDQLEHQISFALQFAAEDDESEYWCDGVYPPLPDDNAPDHILSKREITTTAIIPRGQYEEEDYRYQLTIKLSDLSYNRLMAGQNLEDCIPGPEDSSWITLDHDNRAIIVTLL